MFIILEANLSNISFLMLFLTMLFYWFQTIFFSFPLSEKSPSSFATLGSGESIANQPTGEKLLFARTSSVSVVGETTPEKPPFLFQARVGGLAPILAEQTTSITLAEQTTSLVGSEAERIEAEKTEVLLAEQTLAPQRLASHPFAFPTSLGGGKQGNENKRYKATKPVNQKFPFLSFFGTFGMSIANLTLISLLILRWQESGHFPLSNLYESLMFLSWSCTSIHLILGTYFFRKNIFLGNIIGCITSPCALFTNAFATFSLPQEMQHTSPLVPALQSNWLMMHVTVMIISYSALILGSLLSIAFLIITNGLEPFSPIISFFSTKSLSTGGFASEANPPVSFARVGSATKVPSLNLRDKPTSERLSFSLESIKAPLSSESLPPEENSKVQLSFMRRTLAENLDNLSYRVLGLGFPFLTIGILSGAVWANEAWGSYWSWDPKETWAFLTWLVFAIYLHTRLTKGWQGKKPAIIASFGFITVWICFLGVNLLGEGLHSYGWIVKS